MRFINLVFLTAMAFLNPLLAKDRADDFDKAASIQSDGASKLLSRASTKFEEAEQKRMQAEDAESRGDHSTAEKLRKERDVLMKQGNDYVKETASNISQSALNQANKQVVSSENIDRAFANVESSKKDNYLRNQQSQPRPDPYMGSFNSLLDSVDLFDAPTTTPSNFPKMTD